MTQEQEEEQEQEQEQSALKKFTYIMITTFIMSGCSFLSQIVCQWWGCYDITFVNLFRADLICNTCTDVSYHLKNHQIAIYGSVFTLLTCQLTNLINRVESPINKYIFDDYPLGKKSPRKLKLKKII